MSAPVERVIEKVGQWMDYADKDLALARHGLTMAENCPYHLVAYHAQQCAEKYLKAYLVLKGVDFPYTHNMLRLMELCPPDAAWLSGIDAAASLSSYAISARYPGAADAVTEAEAREAIRIAHHVRQVVRKALMAAVVAAQVDAAAQRAWKIPYQEWDEARRAEG